MGLFSKDRSPQVAAADRRVKSLRRELRSAGRELRASGDREAAAGVRHETAAWRSHHRRVAGLEDQVAEAKAEAKRARRSK